MAKELKSLGARDASRFARLALTGIQQEYPNKLDHVIHSTRDVALPKALHPAFYGSFDWHSAVHSHWMLIRLLKTYPNLKEATHIRQQLNQNLSPKQIEGELNYLRQAGRSLFERTYGWAWLLKLVEETLNWNDSDGKTWSETLKPLSAHFAELYRDFLPRQAYPIRSGLHPNTAFGLAFALDYACTIGESDLRHLVIERSRFYFGSDKNCPAEWEPSGEDFISPSLMEANLMRRVLKTSEFHQWFHDFLPGIKNSQPETLLRPVQVADRTDGRIVHLDGLNLSRAWCMKSIASALPNDDPTKTILIGSADDHARTALPHVSSGDYSGEHWLGTFAVYLLTTPKP